MKPKTLYRDSKPTKPEVRKKLTIVDSSEKSENSFIALWAAIYLRRVPCNDP